MVSRLTSFVLGATALAGFAYAAIDTPLTIAGSARVIDGDTIQIGENRIRLFGIDAPERHQTCSANSVEYACGLAATAFMQKMVQDVTVTCLEKARDRYSRIVATCSTVGGDLGLRMVANGHAVDYTQYSRGAYKDAEDAARTERLGIWAGTFTRPDQYRREHRR